MQKVKPDSNVKVSKILWVPTRSWKGSNCETLAYKAVTYPTEPYGGTLSGSSKILSKNTEMNILQDYSFIIVLSSLNDFTSVEAILSKHFIN